MWAKRFICSIVMFFVLSSLLFSGQLGLGVIIGAPTGLSLKFWQSSRTALDLALAWDFGKDYLHLHGDYLYHFPLEIEGVSRSTFCWNLGIGARLRFKNNGDGEDDIFGVRFVGGLEFLPREVPLDVFLEIAPVLNIIKSTDVDLEGGIGIRYNFNL